MSEEVGAKGLLHSRAKILSGTLSPWDSARLKRHEDGAHNLSSSFTAATGDAAWTPVRLAERLCKEYDFDFIVMLSSRAT
jgi:hypothetical protein